MSIAQLETMAGRIYFGKFVKFERKEMCIWLENVSEIESHKFIDKKRGIQILRRKFCRNNNINQKQNEIDIASDKQDPFNIEIDSSSILLDEIYDDLSSNKEKKTMKTKDYTMDEKNFYKRKIFSFMKFSLFKLKYLTIDSFEIKVNQINEHFSDLQFPFNAKTNKISGKRKIIENNQIQNDFIFNKTIQNKSYINISELNESFESISDNKHNIQANIDLSFFDDTSISDKSFYSKNSRSHSQMNINEKLLTFESQIINDSYNRSLIDFKNNEDNYQNHNINIQNKKHVISRDEDQKPSIHEKEQKKRSLRNEKMTDKKLQQKHNKKKEYLTKFKLGKNMTSKIDNYDENSNDFYDNF